MVKLVTAEHRLKGDRNAYEEICADSAGTVFSGRIGSRNCRLRFDHTCASAVCESTSPSATTGLQSIQSQYRASTELQTPNTFNTKHVTFNTKHRSKW